MKETIIISAQIPAATIMNKYRHKMLVEALEKCELGIPAEGAGFDGKFKEQILVLTSNNGYTTEEFDMLGTLAIAFGQEYFLRIYNDRCYKVDPLTLTQTYLGVWWQVSCHAPARVLQKIARGLADMEDGAYSYYGMKYYGLHTKDEMSEYASELQAKPYSMGKKIEEDAAKARSYPY